MSNLKPINLLPARERVASALRKAILSRELQEGEELTLDSIANQLQVSSTPVREAFQILARDGLLKLRPNKAVLVLGINEKTIRDHYEARALLEREAAARVCRLGVDISGIVSTYEQAATALEKNDAQEYSSFNQTFHMEIWTASGNDKMKFLLSSLWNGLPMGHRVTKEAYARISIAEHKQILDALIIRDAHAASESMNRHILRSMEDILTHLQQGS